MSGIKRITFERPFVLEHDHCEGSGDGHPCGGCASCCEYPFQVCDKNGKTAVEFHSAITEEQARAVVAALNAQPDAGDVVSSGTFETLAAWHHARGEDLRDARARESALRAERDALAAEVATLRGALERISFNATARTTDDEAEFGNIVDIAQAALAAPASPAAERVMALDALWAAVKRFDDRQRAIGVCHPEDPELNGAKEEFDAAVGRLRALDGTDGDGA